MNRAARIRTTSVPPQAGDRRRSGARPRGVALVYITMTLVALFAVCSLGVDVARVLMVKSELQLAADAAARYGAQTLARADAATARVCAVDGADDNTADGTPVALNGAQDVEFGNWNASDRTFTALSGSAESSANAVRVTARRTRARDNPVRLSMAWAVGVPTADVRASAVATVSSRRPGIVGLDFITLSGTAGSGVTSNSYRSSSGPFGSGTTTYGRGTLISNGNVSVSGNANVGGDVWYGPGKNFSAGGGGSLSGTSAELGKAISYPMESAGAAATTNDNWSISSPYLSSNRDLNVGGNNAVTSPGGMYYLNNVSIAGQASVTFTGPTTVYVTGKVKIDGTVTTSGNMPANLRIVMVTAGTTFDLNNNVQLCADVYAPGSAVTLSGNATLLGSIVGKSVSMGGSSKVYFDESLTVTSPGVSLVR